MPEETQYTYKMLKPKGVAFRVVKLCPGSQSDDIFISIPHIVSSEVRYEALSYTWGDPDQARCRVYVLESGRVPQYLEVGMSLLQALKYLRHPTMPRTLWIDAICINQEDIAERSQEVARMGEIYRKADQVVAWLGQDDDDTPVALKVIETLSAGVIMEWHHKFFTTVPGSEASLLKSHSEHSAITSKQWAALRAFITRPWFQRLWIRQEVDVASKVIVMCGHYQAAWNEIEKVALLLEQSSARAHFNLSDILFCRSIFPYHGSDNLTYILHRSSLCGHSESRDIVYANLSTSSAIKALNIKPDYTLSVGSVYKDLVTKYIRRYGTLECLRSCDLRTVLPDVESFVPNFSMPRSESRLVDGYAHGGSRHLPAIITDGAPLKLSGKPVATIEHVSEFQRTRETNFTDFTQTDKKQEIMKIYRHWEPDDLFTASYPTGCTLLDAYVLLLAGGTYNDVYGAINQVTIVECKETFLAVAWSGGNLDLVSDIKYWPYLGGLCSDRRFEFFFRTVEGYIGTSPSSVKARDIVAVLVGGNTPFVLRPVSVDEPRTYQIVGPCYLQGVMFGEALLGQLPEPWSCVENRDIQRWCFQNQLDGRQTLEDPRLWPLPALWQLHYCDTDGERWPCEGTCTDGYGDDRAGMRCFFNADTKEKTTDDPRLDLTGLVEGGVILNTFVIV